MDDTERYTAQLVDGRNTARCATLIIAGMSAVKAESAAHLAAEALDMGVADFYVADPA